MGSIRNIGNKFSPVLRDAGMLIILLACCIIARAQDGPDRYPLPQGEEYIEKLALFTDRSTYITGETVHYRIMNLSPPALKEIKWSRVVYIELLGWDRQIIEQQKLELNRSGNTGSFTIPESTISGHYYLRAYTRWMRNFDASDFACRRLRVINPQSSELASVRNGSQPGTAGVDPNQVSRTGGKDYGEDMIRVGIDLDKELYGIREKVGLEVRLPEGISGDLCLSVVRKKAAGTTGSCSIKVEGSGPAAETEGFIPETRGMVISGKVISRNSREPLANSRVQLSLIGENPDYFGYLTAKDGRFFISLPDFRGTKDFYISAVSPYGEPVEILIDQDFCTRDVRYSGDEFIISKEERSFLEEMLINSQVSQVFIRTDQVQASVSISDPRKASEAGRETEFYGEPDTRILIDDYVKLPTLEEFIYELIPQAFVKRRGGKTSLVIQGDDTDLAIYQPLVLLDHVAVTDLNAIVNLSPENIESIDLVSSTYIRGDIKYGGILSITSKKRDLAGMDLPEGSYFFNFRTLGHQLPAGFPDYSSGKGDLRIPDFRNTLYWEGNLSPSEDGLCQVDFYTSDLGGEFLVLVRGYSSVGNEIWGTATLRVEQPR